MPGYTIGLAVYDYLPVLLSAVGFYAIARLCGALDSRHATAAAAGAVLAVTGGLLKASWKLLLAAGIGNFQWMSDALFICLSAGMLLMCLSLFCARLQFAPRLPLWNWPLLVWLLAIYLAWSQPDSRNWVIPLLAATTLGNLLLGLQLIRLALQARIKWAAVLFGLNLLAVFGMSALARAPEQTAQLQWIEQSINAVSQLAFAVAAMGLLNYVTLKPETGSKPS